LQEQMAAVERARAAAEARLKAAEALPDALYREAFHNVVPLTADPIPSDTIEGWKWHELNRIARLESGHTPSRLRPEWWGGDVRWLALPDIRLLDGKVAFETTENTNPQGLANSAARMLPAGTVCLSRTASVGFVSIMGRPMATSQDFANWVCGPKLEPTFLMHILRASRRYFRSLASGATHQTVYMPTLKSFKVLLPEREEQDRIAGELMAKLYQAEQVIAHARAELKAVNAMPAALLRKAFG
jgi:type I restriction enzyme S subunit